MTGLRESKKQQTRKTIVQEAGRLFTERGFQVTTMEDIAGEADVSVATLYNYFGTKNTVLLAYMESSVTEMMEAGRAVLDSPPRDMVDAVQSLALVYLDQFLELERELLREVFAAGFGPSSEFLPELIRLDELLVDQLGILLHRFAESGELAPGIDVTEAALFLYSLLGTQLLMYSSVEHISSDTLRRSVARQIEIAFSGLRAQER